MTTLIEPSSGEEQRLLVSLCTYNEAENLDQLIPAIHQFVPHANILVVDDDSPDGTGKVADQLAADDSRIHVIHRVGERGLGTATLVAFEFAIAHSYELLINLDADFSHHPRHIPALLDCMRRVDVAVGSRYVSGGGIQGWPLLRHFMSRGINLYARLLLGLKTRDNSGSYRCYRVSRLAQLDFGAVRGRGYAFQEEILYRCRAAGCSFEESPIVFENRRHGESKINGRESLSALWTIFRLAIDRLLGVSVIRSGEIAEQSPKSS